MNARLGSSLILAWVVVGCGQSSVDPDRPATVPVTGTVTYNGQAIEGAIVGFMANSSDGRGAAGSTDASGRFTLTTFDPGDGAIPGTYRVKITKTVVENTFSEEEYDAAMEHGKTVPAPVTKELVPVKYKDEKTSGLTAEVQADSGKHFAFELTD